MSEVIEIATVVKRLRGCRQPFNYAFSTRIDQYERGLYAFWLGRCCLYVGKSKSLKQRLRQHRMSEPNTKLKQYMSAFWRDIEASCVRLPNQDDAELSRLEIGAIQQLRPKTNVLHQQK